MKVWKKVLLAMIVAAAVLILPALPGMGTAITVKAASFTFLPEEDPGKHVYAFEDKEVEIHLKNSDYTYEDYMNNYDKVIYESSNKDVVVDFHNGFSSYSMFCGAVFCGTGDTTITAKLDGSVIGTFKITVKADDLKLDKDRSTLVYSSPAEEGYGFLTFNHPINTVTSSDPSVCKVSTTEYWLQEDVGDYETTDIGEDHRCQICPMKPGEVTVTVTDILGKKISQKIIINKSWFQSLMKQKSTNCFCTWETAYLDADYMEIRTSKNLRYGTTTVLVKARYGTKITLKVGKKKYKTVTANQYDLARIPKVSLVKLKTKVTLTCKLGGVTEVRKGKIVSGVKVDTDCFNPKSKNNEVWFYNVSKGDVLKVIVGNKTVKKKKITKAKHYYELKFKLKKKLKKNQKIRFVAYNKFGQKLVSLTEKVR